MPLWRGQSRPVAGLSQFAIAQARPDRSDLFIRKAAGPALPILWVSSFTLFVLLWWGILRPQGGEP